MTKNLHPLAASFDPQGSDVRAQMKDNGLSLFDATIAEKNRLLLGELIDLRYGSNHFEGVSLEERFNELLDLLIASVED